MSTDAYPGGWEAIWDSYNLPSRESIWENTPFSQSAASSLERVPSPYAPVRRPAPTGPPCEVCRGQGRVKDNRNPTRLRPCPFCRGSGTNSWRVREARRQAELQLWRKLGRVAHWVAIFVVLAIVVRSPTGVPPVWEMFAWLGLVLLKPILWVNRAENQSRRDRGYR